MATQFFLSQQMLYCTTMIPINLHHCNIFSGNILKSTAEMINLYVQFVSSLNVLGLECNNCHWKGSCIRHGYYQRSYLLNVGDLMSGGTKIKILRVKCKHCGRTHAILPEEIVPYLSFSTVFIYPILWQYYAKEKTIEAICREFQIAVPQLYRWKERFEKQKDRFLGVLKSMRYKGKDALSWLSHLQDYVAEFAGKYLSMTEKMPMQQHANPPNTRLPIFS